MGKRLRKAELLGVATAFFRSFFLLAGLNIIIDNTAKMCGLSVCSVVRMIVKAVL